jgi:hypothetical protein
VVVHSRIVERVVPNSVVTVATQRVGMRETLERGVWRGTTRTSAARLDGPDSSTARAHIGLVCFDQHGEVAESRTERRGYR